MPFLAGVDCYETKVKVLYYVDPAFDAGMYDFPDNPDINPEGTREGYFIDVVHEADPTNSFSESKILIENDNNEIIRILPRQLIKFLN